MRPLATAALCAVVCAAGPAPASAAGPESPAAMRQILATNIRAAGHASGAYVFDLDAGKALFAASANVRRMPASVEKIYTTSAALLRFGPTAVFQTQLLATGSLAPDGTWQGTLYLKGGGDPTFGSAAFDRANYGSGATIEQLVANLLAAVPITRLSGNVVGDESLFDSMRGTAPYGFQAAVDIGDPLSALDFDGGLNPNGSYQTMPPVYAAQRLVLALRAAGVSVHRGTPTTAGVAPPGAPVLASVDSPDVARLVKLTNIPSDNFFAETLLKDLGAEYGGAGTSAAGAAVVKDAVAGEFGIHPALEDGSGLSRRDRTSPLEVVTALSYLSDNPDFVASLPVAGRTGTLKHRLRHTYAAGRCEAKTGTLRDASNLAGYCHARDGHTLAFAFLMNAVNPAGVHPLQDAMTAALAQYAG